MVEKLCPRSRLLSETQDENPSVLPLSPVLFPLYVVHTLKSVTHMLRTPVELVAKVKRWQFSELKPYNKNLNKILRQAYRKSGHLFFL